MSNRLRKKNKANSQSYWQSYSDMMAALLLMFVLIMAFTLAQSLQVFEEKARVQDEQNAILMEQQELLKEQQKQIDELIGVKADIIEALREAFKDSNLSIEIDSKTGAIRLDSSLLFAYNSSKLSKEGATFLKKFLPRYMSVLMSDQCRPYISEIIFEGHTDTSGDYMYNLNLSQERAYSVASYCLNSKQGIFTTGEIKELRKLITANGKSFSNPIYNGNGKVDAKKSRRVEIKFRLQDEEMITRLQEIIDGEKK